MPLFPAILIPPERLKGEHEFDVQSKVLELLFGLRTLFEQVPLVHFRTCVKCIGAGSVKRTTAPRGAWLPRRG